ncbi:MAG: hypothetical protein ACR2N7_02495 [Acidimicrobiia bacterium]
MRDESKAYQDRVQAVSAVLYELDPIGINFGDNTDEYDPEARTIVARLGDAQPTESDLVKLVHKEFRHWFGIDAGNRSLYVPIAQERRRRGLA